MVYISKGTNTKIYNNLIVCNVRFSLFQSFNNPISSHVLHPEVLLAGFQWVVCVGVVIWEHFPLVDKQHPFFLVREQVNQDTVSKTFLCNLDVQGCITVGYIWGS